MAAGLLPSPLGADILALLGGVPGAADSFLLVCWGSADVVRWRDVEALRRSLTNVAYVLRCSFGVGIPWLDGAHGVLRQLLHQDPQGAWRAPDIK